MRAAHAKKLRQQARREVARRTRREVSWWARPRVFRAWAMAGAWAVNVLARLGWRRPAQRWLAVVRSTPQRGTRLVLR
jgi:hypothetical protein